MVSTSRQAGLRLYVCLGALLTGYLGLQEQAIMYPGAPYGSSLSMLSWLIVALASAGLIDLVANDAVKRDAWWRLPFKFLGYWRDIGYLSVASAHAALLFLASLSEQTSARHLEFGLVILACAWIAVKDVIRTLARSKVYEEL